LRTKATEFVYAFVAYLKPKHSSILLEASKHILENFIQDGGDMISRLHH
jgi:hypothetical protein